MRISKPEGFTLIEISIVLVIIGLIVGGVLVGRDLITAATIRSQIAQIEKFNTSKNTFLGKYGQLPGDITSNAANQFGLAARGQYAGQGDGNFIIEGINGNSAGRNVGNYVLTGESALFWVDLTTAGLIDGSFTTATATGVPNLTATAISSYLPSSKIGSGIFGGSPFVYVGSSLGFNFFGISSIGATNTAITPSARTTLRPKQAYALDSKMDDGMPTSGNVIAAQLGASNNISWILNYFSTQFETTFDPLSIEYPGNSTTCFEGASSSTPVQYSITQTEGAFPTCGLLFRFQ